MAEQIPSDPSKIPSLKEPANEFEKLLEKQFKPSAKTLPPEKSDFEKLLEKPFKPEAKTVLPKPPRKLPKLPKLGKAIPLIEAGAAVLEGIQEMRDARTKREAKAKPAPEPSTDRGGRLPDGTYKREQEGDPDGKRLLRFRDVIQAAADELDDAEAESLISILRAKLLSQGNKRELETLAPLFPGQPVQYVNRRTGGTGYDGKAEPFTPPKKTDSQKLSENETQTQR